MSTASSEFATIVDGREVPVHVRRNARAKRMRLRYDPVRGRLQLVLPLRAALRPAQLWTHAQTPWVAAQMAKAAPLQLVGAGTCLPWGGDSLLIDWVAGLPRAPRFSDDGGAGARLTMGGPVETVGRRAGRWLRAHALSRLTIETHAMAQRAGVTCSAVAIGDPRGRWGSCSASGRIRYNWRIIMAPDFVRSALVAHEVAHRAHMHHGPAFHALVGDLVGAAVVQCSRDWLRAHGAALHRWQFDG